MHVPVRSLVVVAALSFAATALTLPMMADDIDPSIAVETTASCIANSTCTLTQVADASQVSSLPGFPNTTPVTLTGDASNIFQNETGKAITALYIVEDPDYAFGTYEGTNISGNFNCGGGGGAGSIFTNCTVFDELIGTQYAAVLEWYGGAGIANGADFDVAVANGWNLSDMSWASTPEPSSLLLLGTGLLGLAAFARRRFAL